MLVSFTLTPMLCSRLLKRAGDKPAGAGVGPDMKQAHSSSSKDTFFFRWMNSAYGRMLEWSLDHRAVVILIAIGAFALTFPLNGLVGRDFVPADDQSEFQVTIDTPPGTSVEGTAKIAADLASRYEKIPGVVFAWPNIGERSNHSHIYLRLIDVSQRKWSNLDMADVIRRTVHADPKYRDLRVKFFMPSALGGGEFAGTLQPMILGPDFYRAAALATDKSLEVRKIKGLVDVIADTNLNMPELQVHIDRQRASDLGVRAADVANAVRLMIAGTDQISTYKEGEEQYDVTMQLLPEQQRDPQMLARLMIPSSKVGQVRLDNIASLQRGFGPTRIDRYNRSFQV